MNPAIAMDNSFENLKEWKDARSVLKKGSSTGDKERGSDVKRWKPPALGELKINVDASFFAGVEAFSVGMAIRDHEVVFLKGKCITLSCLTTVVEVECLGLREALSWVMKYPGRKVMIETDSLLMVRALHGKSKILLEVGHVIDHYKMML